MIGVEGILSLAAYATAIIATLQAGSRARYILEHNEIGVKDGPLILPPKNENETSPLWDLVQVFQESVKLGLLRHGHMESTLQGITVQASSEVLGGTNSYTDNLQVEPYSLSPFPKPKPANEDEILDQLVDMYIEEGTQKDAASENVIWRSFKSLGSKVLPMTIISKVKQTTNYWMKRAYYWRKSIEEFEEDVLEGTDEGMWHGLLSLLKFVLFSNFGFIYSAFIP